MEGKIIVRYIICLSTLVLWIHSTTGCGSCRSCGGLDLRLPQASGPDCVTPCGTEVWFGDFGPVDCARIARAEKASLGCINLYVYEGRAADPSKLCSGLKGAYVLLNSETPPPYGRTWTEPRLVIEVLNGNDWRVNTWAHEMGHATEFIFTGDADQDHVNFTRGPGGVFDAMSCTQDEIFRTWSL